MECNNALELLSEYIDGMLDDTQELQDHLNTCEKCREEYELLTSVVDGCHQFNEIDLPDGFHQKIHDRLIQDSEKANHSLKSPKKYYSIAAAALIFAISIGIIINSGILNLSSGSQKKTGTTKQEQNMTYGSPETPKADVKAAKDSGAVNNVAAPQSIAQPKVAATSVKMEYSVITININNDQYKKYFTQISSDIKAFGGSPTLGEKESYSMPQSNMDTLINKLKEDYKINNVSVTINDITKQYSELEQEIAGQDDTGGAQNTGSQVKTMDTSAGQDLKNKRNELNDLKSKLGNAIIEFNIK